MGLTECRHQKLGKYIAQVARFDPSKGIDTVIDAYAQFRRMCEQDGITDVPQLCMYAVLSPSSSNLERKRMTNKKEQ